jgi:hypothetical protein
MTRLTRQALEGALIHLKKQDGITLTEDEAKAMSVIKLVYGVLFLQVKFGLDAYTEDEIDSLIYH